MTVLLLYEAVRLIPSEWTFYGYREVLDPSYMRWACSVVAFSSRRIFHVLSPVVVGVRWVLRWLSQAVSGFNYQVSRGHPPPSSTTRARGSQARPRATAIARCVFRRSHKVFGTGGFLHDQTSSQSVYAAHLEL